MRTFEEIIKVCAQRQREGLCKPEMCETCENMKEFIKKEVAK